MKTKKPRLHGKRQRYLAGIMGAGIIALSSMFLGCQGADSESGPGTLGLTAPATTEAAAGFTPPTLGELLAEVELTTEQLQPMETALDNWTTAVQSRRETRQSEGRRGKRGGNRQSRGSGSECGPRFGGRGAGVLGEQEPPMRTFLAESAEILEPEQFSALATFLAERREAHREAIAGNRPGRSEGFRGRGGPGRLFHGQKQGGLIDNLDLTEEQQTTLREAREQMRDTMRSLVGESGGRGRMDETTREQIRQLREQMKGRMESILTPEQLAQLEELRDERRAERQDKREVNFAQRLDRRVEFLSKVLDLDETQQQQISDILTENHEQVQTLHQNAREQDLPVADLREEIEKIREEADTAIRELLTAEQAAMFDALRSLMPRHRGPGRGFHRGR
ncbi:hypothetical protein ACFLQW_00135 [Candidatus Zixiibacteriota bacterium]